MTKFIAEGIICCIGLVTSGLLLIINTSFTNSSVLVETKAEYRWIFYGIQNIIGYSTVLLPSYLVYKYIRKVNYLDKANKSCFSSVILRCFGEEELPDRSSSSSAQNNQQTRTLFQDASLLLFYFISLQVSFLTWGVLQEKVMTQNYSNTNGDIGHFTDSQFLVFVNRILAFFMSGGILLCTRQPRHKAPLYKYVFCSLSNILSSWCQYEALKYVSFPHQVLAKSAKVIPVMIMGRIISRAKYEYYEYVTTFILSIGMLFFMIDAENDHKGSTTVTTFSGLILLCLYIAFDSFTSNWQGTLFKQFGMSPVQMMCAINLFSCIFTVVSLLQHGGFVSSIRFMLQFPAFVFDCVLLSICSAAGQLFIFRTIATFGPLVFAIITTIRQGLSVLLSCIIYQHNIPSMGIFGVILIFLSIFLRIYCAYRIKLLQRHAHVTNT